jgi:hypothetical protein
MRHQRVLVAALAVGGLSGFAASANAGQVTYELAPGTPSEVVVTATEGSSSILFSGSQSITLLLTSGSTTLDTTALELDSFSFVDASAGPTTLSVSGGNTLGSLSLTNLTLSSNTATALSGTNPYTFATTAATDSAQFSFTSAANGKTTTGTISGSNQSFAGSIATATIGTDSFDQATAINLGTMTIGGQTVTLKGDVVFDGQTTVPVPAGIWLLVSGFGALGLARVRRSSTSAVTG